MMIIGETKIQKIPYINRSSVTRAVSTVLRPQQKMRFTCALSLWVVLSLPIPLQAATFAVTNIADQGAGSLRNAITLANANVDTDEIIFDASVTGSILLTNGHLVINSPLIITGPGAAELAIDGGKVSRAIINQSVLSISGLTITGGQGYNGGGILNDSGELTVISSTISGNAATSSGAGIHNSRGQATIINSKIIDNTGSFIGAGIHNTYGTVAITGSAIVGNRAIYSGGGINNTGNLTVTNSAIIDNTAAYGGGIQHSIGTMTVTETTISGNAATNGGGAIGNYNGGNLAITNSTISSNIVSSGGGVYTSSTDAVSITNTIVAKQFSGNDCVTTGSGTIVSNGYNLDSDGSCHFTQSSDMPNTDPLLSLLVDNGGPTFTHALLPGSPAIDAITTGVNGCGTTYVIDQRGEPRPRDGNNDSVVACDLGAFEKQAITSDDIVIDFGGLGLWSRINDSRWQKLSNRSPDQVVMGDMDGNGDDDVIADFGSSFGGLFVIQDLVDWSKLHNSSPELMAVGDLDNNGKDDVVIDFGTIGLWARMNDISWLKLNNNSPSQLAVGDVDGNGDDDVIAVFSSGLFVKRNLGGWSQFHNLIPETISVGDLDGNGKDDVVIDFGSIGFWARMNDSSWSKLHNSSPALVTTGDLDGNGADDIVATFSGSGLWKKVNLGGWSILSTSEPDEVLTGDVDGSGQADVIANFGSTIGGVYVNRNQGGWSKLHNISPDSMETGNLDSK